MFESGLSDVLRHRTEFGADVPTVTKFVDHHQNLLRTIEVRRFYKRCYYSRTTL